MSESLRTAPLSASRVIPNGKLLPDARSSRDQDVSHPLAGQGLAAATALRKRLFQTFEGHLAMRLWRYIFPDCQLDTVSDILRGMEQGGFEIADVESLRPHYAMTLRRWVARLEKHHEEALEHVDESTYRCWRLYMAACALEFESGEIGVYQLLASKRTTGSAALPLTRRHLYSTRSDFEGRTS